MPTSASPLDYLPLGRYHQCKHIGYVGVVSWLRRGLVQILVGEGCGLRQGVSASSFVKMGLEWYLPSRIAVSIKDFLSEVFHIECQVPRKCSMPVICYFHCIIISSSSSNNSSNKNMKNYNPGSYKIFNHKEYCV